MQKWVTEDWGFELTVTEGKAGHCRLGLEEGDKFIFSYECPAGMCPKTMAQLYTWCEVCLLYTSDAADDLRCVDLCGRRIIKKKILVLPMELQVDNTRLRQQTVHRLERPRDMWEIKRKR